MAVEDNNGRFATMANNLVKERENDIKIFGESLYLFMLNPDLKNLKVEESSLPTNYKKQFQESGVLRVRRGDMSFTVLEDNSKFLNFRVGELNLYMKMSASFFGIGQFNVNTQKRNKESITSPLKKVSKGYKLDFNTYGCYYQPFDNKNKKLDWGQMKYDERKTCNKVKLNL